MYVALGQGTHNLHDMAECQACFVCHGVLAHSVCSTKQPWQLFLKIQPVSETFLYVCARMCVLYICAKQGTA